MDPLTNAQIRELKARAQRVKASVKLGKEGLSDALVSALVEALKREELVKVKFEHHKEKKRELAPLLAERTASHLVTRVGNVVVLFKPRPPEKE